MVFNQFKNFFRDINVGLHKGSNLNRKTWLLGVPFTPTLVGATLNQISKDGGRKAKNRALLKPMV